MLDMLEVKPVFLGVALFTLLEYARMACVSDPDTLSWISLLPYAAGGMAAGYVVLKHFWVVMVLLSLCVTLVILLMSQSSDPLMLFVKALPVSVGCAFVFGGFGRCLSNITT